MIRSERAFFKWMARTIFKARGCSVGLIAVESNTNLNIVTRRPQKRLGGAFEGGGRATVGVFSLMVNIPHQC